MNHKVKLLEALAQLDEFSSEIENSTPLNRYFPLSDYIAKKLNINKEDVIVYVDEFNGRYSTFVALFPLRPEPEIYNFQNMGFQSLPRKSREALAFIDKIMNGSLVLSAF